MKTFLKNEAICLIILTISILLFTDCNHNTVQHARGSDFISAKPLNYFDTFDTIMLAKVHKAAVDSLKNQQVSNLIFKDTIIEEQYIAELCKCYVESNNILELTLKSKSNLRDCIGSPVGYQRFRLTLYKFVTTVDTAISFYTFAAIEKNVNRDERMQNFYISEVISSQTRRRMGARRNWAMSLRGVARL